MANDFYNRNSSFNPDELADGDAIEAEFDAVSRGFDTIEDLVNANQAGYPEQTFHVAPATLDTHAVPKAQMETALSFKLDAVNYNATDILSKLKTVDGTDSGLDADYLDGQHGSYYRNADNINAGTLAKERLPGSIDASTSGNAATATQTAATAAAGATADLVKGAMGTNDFFRIRVGGNTDAGWTEIATADNGDEPIYVRQYNGDFVSIARTLILLDASGNSVFPGNIRATTGGVTVKDTECGMYPGNGDNATSATNNLKLSSLFGIGFGPSISGQSVPYGEYSHWFNVRNGDMGVRGTITAPQLNGNAATAARAQNPSFSTAGGSGENQLIVACAGYADAYLFSNSGAWGMYSANGGTAFQYQRWDGRFIFNGHANTAGRAAPSKADGSDMNFYWAGQGGQPAWLWGGSDGVNMYVYNPSNFSVNYANSAGATNSAANAVAVLTGVAYHGSWLPIPDGYSEGQCRFFISLHKSNPNHTVWDLREGISTNHYMQECFLQNNRQGVMQTRVYNDVNDSFEWHYGYFNYLVIGVR